MSEIGSDDVFVRPVRTRRVSKLQPGDGEDQQNAEPDLGPDADHRHDRRLRRTARRRPYTAADRRRSFRLRPNSIFCFIWFYVSVFLSVPSGGPSAPADTQVVNENK